MFMFVSNYKYFGFTYVVNFSYLTKDAQLQKGDEIPKFLWLMLYAVSTYTNISLF